MNKYTATQLNKETNKVLNDATIEPVLIEHKKRDQVFVLMTEGEYQQKNDLILELNETLESYEND